MKMYYTTTSDLNNAERISKIFLNDKKAVCINLIKNVNSFYLDDNSVNFANEIIMIIKTKLKKNEIERYINKIHNYETPLIVEIKLGSPNLDYANWFAKNAE
mgnify:FL=1